MTTVATEIFRIGNRITDIFLAAGDVLMFGTLFLLLVICALPLLLLFSIAQSSVVSVANSELVAEEIVRTLVGSIGLVASVPVTTALAALVVSADRPGRETAPAGVAAAASAGPTAPGTGPTAAPGAKPAPARGGKGRRRKH